MWIFIDVPPSEVDIARQAGAEYHRKRKLWYFDDRKDDPVKFARWKRLPSISTDTPVADAEALERADLSLHEVSQLTGHTSKVIRALVDCDRFPRPIDSSGVSSRSDRWSRAQIKAWLDANGFAGLTGTNRDDPLGGRREDDSGSASFISMAEIAKELSIAPLGRLFQILRDAGILITSDEDHEMNRPTEEYMRKGWFGRVERYLPTKGQRIYQTVVTAAGHKEVLALVCQAMED